MMPLRTVWPESTFAGRQLFVFEPLFVTTRYGIASCIVAFPLASFGPGNGRV